MKILLMIYIFLFSSFVIADDQEPPIERSDELQDWCKKTSGQHFIAQNITPYNWSSSRFYKDNILYVNGEWNVDSKPQTVICRIFAGSPIRYAIIEIPTQKISPIVYATEAPINNITELEKWCMYESAHNIVSKNVSPYRWESSHSNKDNYLFVQGSWRASNFEKYIINCSVRAGVAEKYAILKMTEK